MDTKMQQEIAEAIQKSLPQQVGEQLKKRLNEADEMQKVLENAAKQRETDEKTITAQKAVIEDYAKREKTWEDIQKRDEQVKESERKLELDKLTYQLTAEREKTKFAHDVALGLVRNTEYRRILMDSKRGPEGVDQYGQQRYGTHTQNSDETNKAQ